MAKRSILYIDDPACCGWWIVANGEDAIGPFDSEAAACRAIRKLNREAVKL